MLILINTHQHPLRFSKRPGLKNIVPEFPLTSHRHCHKRPPRSLSEIRDRSEGVLV